MTDSFFEEFQAAGEDLLKLGLTSSHGGNLSVRHAGDMIITGHFAMLGRLSPGDLVEVPLAGSSDQVHTNESNDAGLHRLIYGHTAAGAIIHAHPPHAIALSLRHGMIAPQDLEGAFFLKEIPVVNPEEQGIRLPQMLQSHVAAIVRGHGSYVAARTLNEALAFTSALELSCRVAYLTARMDVK